MIILRRCYLDDGKHSGHPRAKLEYRVPHRPGSWLLPGHSFLSLSLSLSLALTLSHTHTPTHIHIHTHTRTHTHTLSFFPYITSFCLFFSLFLFLRMSEHDFIFLTLLARYPKNYWVTMDRLSIFLGASVSVIRLLQLCLTHKYIQNKKKKKNVKNI